MAPPDMSESRRARRPLGTKPGQKDEISQNSQTWGPRVHDRERHMNTSREVACESDEGIEFHTLVLEVLPRINELDPADHAVSVPKSETEKPSERFSSLLFSVLSPQRQPVQGPIDGSAFYKRTGNMESTCSTRNARRR